MRQAWRSFYEMPPDCIQGCIAVGTIVQCRLSQLAIQKFIHRFFVNGKRSCLINNTANCITPCHLFGLGQVKGTVTVPFLCRFSFLLWLLRRLEMGLGRRCKKVSV